MKQILRPGTCFIVTIIIVSCLVLTSCMGEDGADGIDGEDGKAAIAYSWMGDIWSVSSNDNTIPSVFENGVYYYYASVGTYSYSYSSTVGTWTGYYTIWIDEGEPGKKGQPGEAFWIDGADGQDGIDGEDMCFELYMFSLIGPSFYEYTCYTLGINLPKGSHDPNREIEEKFKNDVKREVAEQRAYFGELNPSNSKIMIQSYIMGDDEGIINMLDSHSDTKIQKGSRGKYSYIHKSLKVSE